MEEPTRKRPSATTTITTTPPTNRKYLSSLAEYSPSLADIHSTNIDHPVENLKHDSTSIILNNNNNINDNDNVKSRFDCRTWELSSLDQCQILIDLLHETGIFNEDITDFIMECMRGYFSVPYHSFGHAVDVTCVLGHFLFKDSIHEWLDLDSLHIAALLISAIGHDLLHPGFNNLFQVNAKTPVAIKYKNQSVLENQSIDYLKDILKRHQVFDKLNLKTLPPHLEKSSKQEIREFFYGLISTMILNTDMMFHFKLHQEISKLVERQNKILEKIYNIAPLAGRKRSIRPQAALVDKSNASNLIEANQLGIIQDGKELTSSPSQPFAILSLNSPTSPKSPKRIISNPHSSTNTLGVHEIYISKLELTVDEKRSVCNILLHAADISNPVRPFDISKAWSDRVVEEFFTQGAEELKRGLPVSPNMDRTATNQCQLSLDFIDIIIHPYFTELAELIPDLSYLVEYSAINRGKWKSMLQEALAFNSPTELLISPVKTEFPVSNGGPPSVATPSTPRKQNDHHRSPHLSEGLSPLVYENNRNRRMSIAAGTIEIPANLTLTSMTRSPNRLGSTIHRSPQQRPSNLSPAMKTRSTISSSREIIFSSTTTSTITNVNVTQKVIHSPDMFSSPAGSQSLVDLRETSSHTLSFSDLMSSVESMEIPINNLGLFSKDDHGHLSHHHSSSSKLSSPKSSNLRLTDTKKTSPLKNSRSDMRAGVSSQNDEGDNENAGEQGKESNGEVVNE